MAGLLDTERSKTPTHGPRVTAIFVSGTRFHNAAAKFWPTLIDEVGEEFPNCSLIEMSAPISGPLEQEHLFPALALERDLNALIHADFEEVMKKALAELELFGPPSSVRIRLCTDEGELLSRELPRDCIDAEILPHLLVWLL